MRHVTDKRVRTARGLSSVGSRRRRFSAALCVTLVLAVFTPAPGSAATGSRSGPPDARELPGDRFFPESISATLFGTLYVSSIETGEVVRFRPGSPTAETFLPAGVNDRTAGVLVDDFRRVLWTCAVDQAFTPTALRAFDLASGELRAEYPLPGDGVCADIALARGDVFVTDTTSPAATSQRPARILRLDLPSFLQATGGTLAEWSADPAFTGPGPALQINGIASDGLSNLYTSNYSTGELIKVPILRDGSPGPAVKFNLSEPFTFPDGIRLLTPTKLLVTENDNRLTLVDVEDLDVENDERIVISDTLDQPTSVVQAGLHLWVTEGQVLRLQDPQQPEPNLPFMVRRLAIPWDLL
jgi:hypothetical protein